MAWLRPLHVLAVLLVVGEGARAADALVIGADRRQDRRCTAPSDRALATQVIDVGTASAEAEIRAALERWRTDFNAGRSSNICDLFAPDLLYDVRGLPEQNYTLLCDRLKRALSGAGPSIQYGLKIKEVILSGDLAVVRLTWISTATVNGQTSTENEEGLDLFRRDSDGTWRIIRYIAYPVE